MHLPRSSWTNTLAKLGFKKVKRKPQEKPASSRNRQLQFESLESRQLLAADLGEIATIDLQQPDADTWQTVQLSRDYVNPVIVAGPLTSNGGHPAQVRVRNVDASTDTFEVQIDEWIYLDDWHTTETFTYMAIEAGSHVLEDGTLIEAGTLNMNLDPKAGQVWFSESFQSSFDSAPVVFTQLASANGSDPAVTRQRNINANSFEVRLREEEKRDNWHVQETVSYVAVETGSVVRMEATTFLPPEQVTMLRTNTNLFP